MARLMRPWFRRYGPSFSTEVTRNWMVVNYVLGSSEPEHVVYRPFQNSRHAARGCGAGQLPAG
jgi:hypothetical protein